jgi:SNF2 family DNA or RNA helicase
LVSIDKQGEFYRTWLDYEPRILAFLNGLPKNLVIAKKETTLVHGINVDVWYRYLDEKTFLKFLVFLKDNRYPINFYNFKKEDFDLIKKAYADRRERIRQVFKGKKKNLDFSNKDFSFLKKEPRDYQKEAFVFFENTNGLAILGDEPGVGKTLSAMSYPAKHKFKTLVLCPASLKLSWRNEVLKFTHEKPFVYKYSPPKKMNIKTYNKEESLFHIINYESLDTYFKLNYSHTCQNSNCKNKFVDHKKNHKVCPKCKLEKSIKSRITKALSPYVDDYGITLNPEDYDLVILDECHYIKNLTSKRTKLVRKMFSTVQRRILLSGTAIKNRTEELFSLLNFVNPTSWENFHYFGLNYCAAYEGNFGWDYKGASNLEELFNKMSPNFLRRLKSDVLKDLPPKTRSEIIVSLTEKQFKEYQKLEQGVIDSANETDEDSFSSSGEEPLFIQSIQKLRQFTNKIKSEFVLDYLNGIKETNRKIVVFSHYVASAESLFEHYKENSVLFTGKKTMQDKQDAVDKFQTDPNCNFFYGTIGAAGVGITLTAADIALFIERAWSPSDNIQAEDRIHRLSQESDTVQIIIMICEGTIDEEVEKLLEKKEGIINMVLDGKDTVSKSEKSDLDIFKQLLYLYKNKKS